MILLTPHFHPHLERERREKNKKYDERCDMRRIETLEAKMSGNGKKSWV